ncbi:RTA1 domain-containing protein [Aspergillus stella-maris]|uniref:RTA1 domain-containing protein n=1 Tax=Aspergillus stella-maris TaxID=1810926 RepID=UPI003CCD58A0
MAADDSIDFELYRYTPSLVGAGLFAGLFLLTTVVHIYQLLRYRSWYFVPFMIGGIFQIIGYGTRLAAHNNTEKVPIYAIQTLLILLAPPLYAASIYMVLGRLIVFLQAQKLSLIRVAWVTKIFVAGDVVAFLMQAAGGGIMATGSADSFKVGENVTIGGLGVQLAFFSVFIVTCGIFHHRYRRQRQHSNSTDLSSTIKGSGHGRTPSANWEIVLIALYVSSILVLIRSIFRLIEYVQGNDGYLISHEAFMYVFDSALMVLVMVVMNVVHPGRVLGNTKQRASQREDTSPAMSERTLRGV